MSNLAARRAAERDARATRELADAIERAWAASPFKRPTIGAEMTIAELRREGR